MSGNCVKCGEWPDHSIHNLALWDAYPLDPIFPPHLYVDPEAKT